MENLWQFVLWILRHAQPVFHVFPKVVAKERPHCKWVSHHCFGFMFSSCSSFRRHGWCNEHPMLPVEGLVYQGNSLWASATKQNCTNGYPLWILPILVHDWAVTDWCTKPWIRMCCFGAARFPVLFSKPACYTHILFRQWQTYAKNKLGNFWVKSCISKQSKITTGDQLKWVWQMLPH